MDRGLEQTAKRLFGVERPFAITMWDFSWLERRWAGAGYLAKWARSRGKPLVTTECWAIVDYKDWPLLDWDWVVLELNRLGVTAAAKTGCWAGMATSNFCGPQFVGMWREQDWHRELTGLIHNS